MTPFRFFHQSTPSRHKPGQSKTRTDPKTSVFRMDQIFALARAIELYWGRSIPRSLSRITINPYGGVHGTRSPMRVPQGLPMS